MIRSGEPAMADCLTTYKTYNKKGMVQYAKNYMQKHTLPIQQTQKMYKKERKNKQQRSLHFVQSRILVLFFLLC